jgi:hypothetical protein
MIWEWVSYLPERGREILIDKTGEDLLREYLCLHANKQSHMLCSFFPFLQQQQQQH